MKKMILIAASCMLAAPFIGSASGWSVSGAALTVDTDSSRLADAGAEDGVGVEVMARKMLDGRQAIQFGYSGWDIDLNVPGNKGVDALVFNYLYGNFSGRLHSYGLVGAGVGKTDLGAGGTNTHAIVTAGLGLAVPVNSRFSIGSEVKWRRSYDDESLAGIDEYDDWSLSLGVSYAFGKTAAASQAASAEPAAAAPVPEVTTPAAKPATLFEADDASDKNSSSMQSKGKRAGRSASGSASGCGAPKLMYTAYFENGSAEISAQDKFGLADAAVDIAKAVRACDNAQIQVLGHTGPTATASAEWLSSARAKQTRQYLCAASLDCDKHPVTTKGMGSKQLAIAPEADVGRLSRRAEVWVGRP